MFFATKDLLFELQGCCSHVDDSGDDLQGVIKFRAPQIIGFDPADDEYDAMLGGKGTLVDSQGSQALGPGALAEA